MSTQIRNFEKKLETIIQSAEVNNLLRNCASDYGGSLNEDSVCVSSMGGNVFVEDTNNLYTGTLNYSDFINDFSLNSYDNGDGTGTMFYTYGNIYTKLVSDAGGFNGNIAIFAQDLTDISAGLNVHSGFNSDHPSNITKYKTMKNKRKELDWKMREIYDQSNSDVNLLFDNSVYVNLAWTVLATSVLYYLFVKL